MIQNPVLRGFHPDPSILRVDDDYYIATSTFEWFPGVLIHVSRDLEHWKPAARPLDRVSQLDMTGCRASEGVWAPCLSYDDGLFYLVYTNVVGDSRAFWDTRNYLVTSPSIEGPWSDPVPLHARGFDPSLFHDADGKKWLVSMESDFRKGKNRFAGIVAQEYDPIGRALAGSARLIFRGAALGLTEGPHLYRRGGLYYLMVAEGGTGLGHAATVARSDSLLGPYEVDPAGPLLSSRDDPAAELQKAGHASLVETQSGEWYLAHLAGRPIPRRGVCTLGRETALQRIEWSADGWPRLSGGGRTPRIAVPSPRLPPHPWDPEPAREDFDSAGLGIRFCTLRRPLGPDSMSLVERPGWLRLRGGDSPHSRRDQSLVARRWQSFRFVASTLMEFESGSFKEMAGLMALYDQENFHYLFVAADDDGAKRLQIMTSENGLLDFPVASPPEIPRGRGVRLAVQVDYDLLRFSWSLDGNSWNAIGPTLDAGILSDERCREGRFTGAFIGLACHDLTGGRRAADFDWFEYREP